jgi:hypothetical protein
MNELLLAIPDNKCVRSMRLQMVGFAAFGLICKNNHKKF